MVDREREGEREREREREGGREGGREGERERERAARDRRITVVDTLSQALFTSLYKPPK